MQSLSPDFVLPAISLPVVLLGWGVICQCLLDDAVFAQVISGSMVGDLHGQHPSEKCQRT